MYDIGWNISVKGTKSMLTIYREKSMNNLNNFDSQIIYASREIMITNNLGALPFAEKQMQQVLII